MFWGPSEKFLNKPAKISRRSQFKIFPDKDLQRSLTRPTPLLIFTIFQGKFVYVTRNIFAPHTPLIIQKNDMRSLSPLHTHTHTLTGTVFQSLSHIRLNDKTLIAIGVKVK